MRCDLGPHSPIFAKSLARFRGNRDEWCRVLLCAPSAQFLRACRDWIVRRCPTPHGTGYHGSLGCQVSGISNFSAFSFKEENKKAT